MGGESFGWRFCTSWHVIRDYQVYYNTIYIANEEGDVYNARGALKRKDWTVIEEELPIS